MKREEIVRMRNGFPISHQPLELARLPPLAEKRKKPENILFLQSRKQTKK